MRTRLLTLDEARVEVAASGQHVVTTCHTTEPFRVAAILWGAGQVQGLDEHDRRLSTRHRRLLDRVTRLGFGSEIVDELDGIASAVGLDDGRFDGWTL